MTTPRTVIRPDCLPDPAHESLGGSVFGSPNPARPTLTRKGDTILTRCVA
jgi:hypothetical protein